MFNLSRKEQDKYHQEQEIKLQNEFLKEYEELCKKHHLQFTPVLRGTTSSLIAGFQIQKMPVEKPPLDSQK